ncbi:MAG: hypothetical protein ACRDRF_13510 [Pseudonocardiaceae bacterium]
MTLPGEAEGFAAMIPADSPWRNAITPDFVTTIAFNRRLSRAHRITCPLWVGLGERDITVHSRSVEGLARRTVCFSATLTIIANPSKAKRPN